MVKNDNHYYIVSQNTSENKYLFEVKNHPEYLCNKPTEVYPTTYDSMYVAVHYGRFDMETGREINELGSHLLQYQNNAFISQTLETSMSIAFNPSQQIRISIHG